MNKYVIGLDFGSLSGRALLVNAKTGEEIAEAVHEYEHAVLYDALPDGTPLPEGSAVQHPRDYLNALRTVRTVMEKAGVSPEDVIGIGVDFTSATILPVDRDLTPLCFQEKFSNRPKAYATMWKDHTAAPQAKAIETLFRDTDPGYLDYCGGICSPENGLAKVLCILQEDPEVYGEAYRILEAGDWITMLLTGDETKVGYNFAICKLFWMKDRGGYPPDSFMKKLDPRFEHVVEEKFGGDAVCFDACFGYITQRAAELTGLTVGTPVSVPIIDSNSSIAACGAIADGRMSMVVGTSLCHILLSKRRDPIPDPYLIAPDCPFEGYTVYEYGQACGGDHLQWYLENCLPASYYTESSERNMGIHALLREKLRETKPGESGLLSLDWFNGNRSVFNDPNLSGLIVGLTLQTKPEEIYRALLEGTVFGTRRIFDSIRAAGLAINQIVACGGIAKKDAFMMQMFADVTGMPIRVASSAQAVALGSAIRASAAAGASRGGYDSIEDACASMGKLDEREYLPNEEYRAIYDDLYAEYLKLHDAFGKTNGVMKRLRDLRSRKG